MSPTSGADGVERPNAKVMTSVSPSWPRCSLLSDAILRRDTKAIESIADDTRSRWSTNPARSRTERAASESRRRPASTSMPRSAFCIRRGIRLDDLPHETVANHVHVREVVEGDPLDPGEDSLDLDQA